MPQPQLHRGPTPQAYSLTRSDFPQSAQSSRLYLRREPSRGACCHFAPAPSKYTPLRYVDGSVRSDGCARTTGCPDPLPHPVAPEGRGGFYRGFESHLGQAANKSPIGTIDSHCLVRNLGLSHARALNSRLANQFPPPRSVVARALSAAKLAPLSLFWGRVVRSLEGGVVW